MDRLQWMKTFVRVVDAGSFTAVARDLGVNQSAVSKQVQALEQWLGVPLLVRTTRRQSITEAGRRFHDRCLQMLETLEDAEREVRQAEELVEGEVTVTASVTFGRLHLVPRLAAFQARYPRLNVRLNLDDAFVDLIAEGVDVAFRLGALRDSRLVAQRIGTAWRMTLASPKYLARRGEPMHPADLLQHDCLIYTRLSEPRRWVYEGADGQPVSVDVKGRLLTSSSEALSQAVREGLGIAYTTQWNFFDELQQGTVVPILGQYRPQAMPLHVVYQPSRRPSLKVKAFVNFFAESFAEDPRLRGMMRLLEAPSSTL